MKEKLTKFSRGVFQYKKPSLLFSQESIEFSLEAGKVYEGNFTITTKAGIPIKGILSKTDHFLKLSKTSFTGTEAKIDFTYDATNLPAGETHVGTIQVISNCGEYEIPFVAKVEVPYFMTELGKIRDLFQFANLAKKDWLGALKLFKSEQFAKKLLAHDSKNEVLYHSLMKSISTSHAMEEFLISIHKKVRINLTVDKSFIEYSNVEESLEDKIVFHKDNWGYCEIHVGTDVDFIEPEHKIIWSENFIGNSFNLKFLVRKDKLNPGSNIGHITLKTQYQSFTVEVIAHGEKEEVKEDKKENLSYVEQGNLISLTQNYLNFRMGRIAVEQYVTEMRQLLTQIYDSGNKELYYFLKGHLAVSVGEEDEIEECFQYMDEEKAKWEEENSTYYCAYQYLYAMKDRAPEKIEEASVAIEACYEKEPDNWRIFWFLMNVNQVYMSDARKRFEELKRLLQVGVKSNIIYHEMSSIYKMYPAFLKDATAESIPVINWMIRENCMTEEVKQFYLLEVSKLKKFHPVVYHCLEKLYEEKPGVEVLQTILSMLVRAQKVGVGYFKWYELGVEQQVRILQLYEYYMYCVEDDLNRELPESLLTYFVMNCTLPDKKRAFLYANILRHQEEYERELVEKYREQIKEFTLKEIEKHAMNPFLAILYEELCKESEREEGVKRHLPYVMFLHELRCNNPEMIGVVVVHEEVTEEVYTPLEDGMAQVAIYTDSAQIFLVDRKNNRYSKTIEYCLQKYLSLDEYAKECFMYAQENGMLLLYLYEQLEIYHNNAQTALALRKRLLLLEELKPSFHWSCYVKLVNYYYETSQVALLDTMLGQVEMEYLSPEDRVRMMELCILRGLDEELEPLFEQYGYDKLSPKRVLVYCMKQLKNHVEQEFTPVFGEMCYYALAQGKHDRTITEFLCEHFIGNVSQLLQLWDVAKNYEIPCHELEEQIVSQSLFVEMETKKIEVLDVFLRYNQYDEKDKLVIRAYLAYQSYQYLLKDEVIHAKLQHIVKEYISLNQCMIINLAYLKLLSQKESLEEQEREYVEIQIQELVKQQIAPAFFSSFKKHVSLPYELANKYLVEYRGDSESKVILHYSYDGKHYKDEVIENMYQGLYVKRFILFHGDTLSYYFSEKKITEKNVAEKQVAEQNGQEEKQTDVVTIRYEDDMSETDSEYSLLNSLLVAKEMQDSKTVLELMKQYVTAKTIMSEHFKMLD